MPDYFHVATPATGRADRLGTGTRRTSRAHRAGQGTGRRGTRRASAQRRPADGTRADRPDARSRHVPGDRHHRRQGELRRGQRDIIDFMPGNCVFGRGTVDGRPVVVAGDDFTLRGGSADASIKGKPKMSEQIAAQFRMPIIRLIEGSGGGGSVKTIETTAAPICPAGCRETTAFDLVANNMGEVPVVGAWPWFRRRSRRGAAGRQPLLGDGQGDRQRSSSPARRWSSGWASRAPSRNSAAGRSSLRCGAVDHAVDTEDDAFDAARRFLSYLPSSIWDVPPRVRGWDDPERREEFADRRSAAREEAGLSHAPHHRGGGRQGQLLRDGRDVRPLDHHRVLRGSTAGRSR